MRDQTSVFVFLKTGFIECMRKAEALKEFVLDGLRANQTSHLGGAHHLLLCIPSNAISVVRIL